MTCDALIEGRPATTIDRKRCGGSAILMTIFVLVLLSGMAMILVFISQTEVRMSVADSQAKQAFYLAEAATERGREQLRQNFVAANNGAIVPRLTTAAGTNVALDFNPANVRPQFTGKTLTGFTGIGDDQALVGVTQLSDGWFAAFLSNDPADGVTNLADTNNFVMVTGLGVRPDGSFEMAQTIIEPGTLFPTIPATITLLGPTPNFEFKSGKGWMDVECPAVPDDPYLGQAIKKSKLYVDGAEVKSSKITRAFNGTDCGPYRALGPVVTVGGKKRASLQPVGGGGVPGLYFPTIGVVGGAAELAVEGNMKKSKIDYLANVPGRTQYIDPAVPVGGYQDESTIADLTDAAEPTVVGSGLGPLHPTWSNCNALHDIIEKLKGEASYNCTPPGCVLPATTASSLSFINGDFRVPCGAEGWGMLVVTGRLDFPATASWHGVIFAIGEGEFYRPKKDGFGNITGGVVVANIAGADATYGTADDCTGGTSGFRSVLYQENKKALGNTVYCSTEIGAADPGYKEPLARHSFRQR